MDAIHILSKQINLFWIKKCVHCRKIKSFKQLYRCSCDIVCHTKCHMKFVRLHGMESEVNGLDKSDVISTSGDLQAAADATYKDNVELNKEQEIQATSQVLAQVKINMPSEKAAGDNVDEYWNAFYSVHQEMFFNNRWWLFTKFLEITPIKNEKPRAILEVGRGVGNSVFPISHCANSNVHMYYCDFSSTAIKILKENSEYNKEHCTAFVCDITNDEWDTPFALESLDVIVLVFVLSAMQPEKLKQVVGNCYNYLKPGGMVLFRDYGRYDMAQLTFKEGGGISENYYSRDDGTLIYFFTQDDVKQLFQEAGFEEIQNVFNRVDRRIQVNRDKQLKMYRVWIQCIYKKL